mmetsp:Transcript_2814/g.4806  ORF Transcript_2814/g.4806 Transcript_2814/m.4806 type:complete len:198 (-) Transcript_2814:234-827(-)
MQARCPLDHPLLRKRGADQKQNCRQCGEQSINKNEYFYQCLMCPSQVLCRACVLVRSKLMKPEMRLNLHKSCLMRRHDPNRHRNWRCNGLLKDRKNLNREKKGCVSDMGSFNCRADNIQSYRCDAHDFDLCLDCAVQCGEFDPSSLKTIFGQAYIQGGRVGLASYHFDIEEGEKKPYISYACAPYNWRLHDGNKPPK